MGRHFLDESWFWGESFYWVCDFLFGSQSRCCQSSIRERIFLMSLLSGASLYVGFVVSCLCVSLAVGMCFIMSLLAGSALAV